MGENKAKPFLKWAGGKGQLLAQYEKYFPIELINGEIETYIEPFIGGGAVFFEVIQKYPVSFSYISDVNQDLILTYQVIQQQPVALLDLLERYQQNYVKTAPTDRNTLFLSVRETFNSERIDISDQQFSSTWIPRAAQLIFLNKTCFNGLFRLNTKGEFNVPFGKYKNPTICDPNNILLVSKLLQNTEIQVSKYQDCLSRANEKTFIYFDPPYRPISRTASFTTYAGSVFTDQEQIELANLFRKLDTEKQAKLMLSNSDPKNEQVGDDFFETIYQGYHLYRVYANRMINSNARKRGQINELVITNYKK